MAAAEVACGLVLGRTPCAPLRSCSTDGGGSGSGFWLTPPARYSRFPSISCKSRRRGGKAVSSQQNRQRARKDSFKKSRLDSNGHAYGDDTTEVPTVVPDTVSSSDGDPVVPTVVPDIVSSSDGDPVSIEDVNINKLNGANAISSFHLEDLMGMIKSAEKNILLLNDAHLCALEDLDKMLFEKEELQRQVHFLEMKLAGAQGCAEVMAQETVHFQLVENELEKLNKETSSVTIDEGKPHVYANGSRVLKVEVPSFEHNNFPSLSEEISALQEENSLLKYDKEKLKAKLTDIKQTDERLISLVKERSVLEDSVRELELKLVAAQEDISELPILRSKCAVLCEKVENLQSLLDSATKQADKVTIVQQQNYELQRKINNLEAFLEESREDKFLSEKTEHNNRFLLQKVKILEDHLQKSEEEINSHILMYEAAVKEFQDTLGQLKEDSKKRSSQIADDVPWEFWSRLILTVDSLLLEKKVSPNDAKFLREMAWKRDVRIHDAYLTCNNKTSVEIASTLLRLASSPTSSGLNVVHIAAEMAPVAKVGDLGDVVSGISKALQKRGNLVEIILPKYDSMQYEHVYDLKMLDVAVQSYFDGQLFKNIIWVGTVEGLPVYFIEPQHPAKFFLRGNFYGEHDDFKRFSFFSRAALELLYQAGKKPDIIHCHDWHTAFVAPLYWDIYAARGFNSARICFTCHNFEYQGIAPALELASCGLDVHHLHRPDRMQDNSSHDKVNLVKGAIVFSNIVTTVSPTYAEEVRTAEGGRGLHETLQFHSRKFVGILNGIDIYTWNPSTDNFLRFQYSADDLHGKAGNKEAMRKELNLSADSASKPLVGCITQLVPQKGVHLIRHAIYRTMELGGQFVLLGSSPLPHIQREFESIANTFQSHPDIRLILKYDEALSHSIYAASDILVIPSIFEPCGLTQMIAMRYGSVPIVRRTGGLNDSVFDVDDSTIPSQLQNGFTFLTPDEQGLGNAMERAFRHYLRSPRGWQQLVQKNMKAEFSWDSSSAQYEQLYHKAVARERAATQG